MRCLAWVPRTLRQKAAQARAKGPWAIVSRLGGALKVHALTARGTLDPNITTLWVDATQAEREFENGPT